MTTMLTLTRSYFPTGTNGVLTMNGKRVCYTIELDWQENEPRESCIPEGEYPVKRRYSQKHGWHLLVEDVPSRSLILFHPANDAQKELLGCIGPVSVLTGPGNGSHSRLAMQKLMALIEPKLMDKTPVVLWITSADGPTKPVATPAV